LAWPTTGCTARRRCMYPTTPLLTWIRWPRHYAPQRRLHPPGASSITRRLARRPPTRWTCGQRSVRLIGIIACPDQATDQRQASAGGSALFLEPAAATAPWPASAARRERAARRRAR